jgi:hypothetical protein
VIDRQQLRDGAPGRGADYVDRPASYLLDDPCHVARVLGNRHVACGVLGRTGATVIRYDHLVMLGE